MDGAGILDFTASNSYSGGTVINNGTVQIDSDGSLGNSTGSVTINNGTTLEALDAIDTPRNFSLGGDAAIQVDSGTYEIDGAVTDGTSGAGTLVVSGSGALELTASNGYSGGTVINGGRLKIDSDNGLGNSAGGVTINNGGTLELLAAETISTARSFTLSGTGTVQVDIGSNYSISGGIADGTSPGTLNKSGSGTLTLSGAVNNSGNINVNRGALIVEGSISGGEVTTVSAGGTLGGAGTISEPVAILAGGTIAPGVGLGIAGTTLNMESNLILSSSANVVINLDSSDNSDILNVAGDLTIASTDKLTLAVLGHFTTPMTYTIAEYGGTESGAFGSIVVEGGSLKSISYGDGSDDAIDVTVIAPVPEPGTWAMLLAGAGILGVWQKNRRSRS
jgi:autotransporter-associated beta strand protein